METSWITNDNNNEDVAPIVPITDNNENICIPFVTEGKEYSVATCITEDEIKKKKKKEREF